MNKIIYSLTLALSLIVTQSFEQTKNPADYKVTSNTGFMENKGQIIDQNYKPNTGVKFLLCQPGLNVQLRQTGFSYDTYTDTLDKTDAGKQDIMPKGKFQIPAGFTRNYHRVDIELVGCNTATPLLKEDKSTAYFNYFTTGTPEEGISDVYYYQKVTYKNIYPNIDLIFFAPDSHHFGKEGTKGIPIEYNFIVHPGGNPADIKLQYKGANKVTLANNPEGTSKLIVNVTAGDFTENIPSSYWKDTKQEVKVNYASLGNNTYGFLIPNSQIPNSTSDLIIDPTPCISWGSYYTSIGTSYGVDIKVDASNNVYVTGSTNSTSAVATAGAFQTLYFGGGADVFIAKFNSTGTALLWGTYYGYTASDAGDCIALDASGNVYIAGTTQGTGFGSAGAYQTTFTGTQNVFVAKFNPTGTTRLWSTYYGGTKTDWVYGMIMDASNNLYITGQTSSTSGIATVGAFKTVYGGSSDAYIAEINSSGTALLWGTYYGGASNDIGTKLAQDASGNIYATGYTFSSTGISTVGAYQATYSGGWDAYIAKFNSNGSSLIWGTYYGGAGDDEGWGIGLDASDNVYIGGATTSSSGIATAGSYQPVTAGTGDGMVAEFNSAGTSLIWGTYFGGSANDQITNMVMDASNNIYVTGITSSTSGIATPSAYQTTYAGGTDIVVAEFNSSGTALQWGTYYGGTSQEGGPAITLDATNNVYITGFTVSSTQIATVGAYQTSGGEVYVAKFGCTGPAPLGVTTSQTNVNCNGVCNGSATANATGGKSPYTYSWSGGQTTSTITGQCANTYTCTVTDAVAATFTVSVTITQPSALTVSTGSIVNILCSGGATGKATATPGGGTGAYTYSWTPSGGTNATASNLTAGTYTITVHDANNCSTTATAVITQPTLLTVSTGSIVNELCNGGATGSATANPGGGTGAYTYSWTPSGGTNATASNLTAGTYTVTIHDANNCSVTANTVITQPSLLTVSTSGIVNEPCNGAATGSATANPGGGTGAYTYSWSPSGGTNATASNLTAGTYTITVHDANNCSTTATAVITQPTLLTVLTGSIVNELCNGGATGSATANPGGGTGAYTYSWTPSGGTNATASNLTAGTYTVTIHDANNCSVTANTVITQPTLLTVLTGSIVNELCNGGATGSATANPGGGTGAYTYSWTPSGGTNATASNLTAGTYTVTIHDANNCSVTANTVITQPSLLTVSTSGIVNELCNGAATGSATANPGGGTGAYTYSWSPSGGTGTSASNLTAGTYTVTIHDANNCSATASAVITQPTLLTANITGNTGVLCNGGSTGIATVTAGGGTGSYVYSWTNGNTTSNATGLSAGGYTVTVTDNNGCSATASTTITQPTLLTANITGNVSVLCKGGSTGSATVTGGGGTGPYTYSWTNGNTTANAIGLTAGGYTVTVTDNNGCSTTASATITEPALLTGIPNANPNTICVGDSSTISVISGGGTPSYTYSWNNGATTSSVEVHPVTVTIYTVTTTDANGCTQVTIVTVGVNALPTLTLTAAMDTQCAITSTDLLTGNPSGGAYSGVGVSGSNFDASAAGVGNHIVTYTYTDGNGCTNSDSIVIHVDICTGTDVTATINRQIRFYPNPFSQSINVDNSSTEAVTASMFNMLGENIGTWALDKGLNTINTSSYPSGVYMIQVKTNNGLLNKKLIKVN